MFELSIGLSERENSVRRNSAGRRDYVEKHLVKWNLNEDLILPEEVPGSPKSIFKNTLTSISSSRPRSSHPRREDHPKELLDLQGYNLTEVSEEKKSRRHLSLRELRDVKAKVDSGITRDETGKVVLKKNPNKVFAEECRQMQSLPLMIPDNPEFKNARLIKSTKGNLAALLFDNDKIDGPANFAQQAKELVEKRGRERRNRANKRDVEDCKKWRQSQLSSTHSNLENSTAEKMSPIKKKPMNVLSPDIGSCDKHTGPDSHEKSNQKSPINVYPEEFPESPVKRFINEPMQSHLHQQYMTIGELMKKTP